MKYKKVWIFILILSVAIILISIGYSVQRNNDPENKLNNVLTEEEGFEILEKTCSDCHNWENVFKIPVIGDQWNFTVSRMVLHHKAQISPWLAGLIADFLIGYSNSMIESPFDSEAKCRRFLIYYINNINQWIDYLNRNESLLSENLTIILNLVKELPDIVPEEVINILYKNNLCGEVVDVLKSSTDYKDFITNYEESLLNFNSFIESSNEAITGSNAQILYDYYCSRCHGSDGSGDTGLRLNDPWMLGLFSQPDLQDFYIKTIRAGRNGTLMIPFGREYLGILSENQLRNLVYFFQLWKEEKIREINSIELNTQPLHSEATIEEGETFFSRMCSDCHGSNGEGDIGPAIKNYSFCGLSEAGSPVLISDSALRFIILNGRGNTLMPAFSKIEPRADVNNQQTNEENTNSENEASNLEPLDAKQTDSIIKFLRSNANPTEFSDFYDE